MAVWCNNSTDGPPRSFLNDIQRLTAKNYVPSNQDVLSARLKTLGVVEHHFALDRGGEKGYDWYIYDVGGHRDQRQIWASFFDDVSAASEPMLQECLTFSIG